MLISSISWSNSSSDSFKKCDSFSPRESRRPTDCLAEELSLSCYKHSGCRYTPPASSRLAGSSSVVRSLYEISTSPRVGSRFCPGVPGTTNLIHLNLRRMALDIS
jgi:hypothetical protein